MIRLDAITHTYKGGRKQGPRTAIKGLSLDIPDGAFCILSGPNGSGKSTLFRILCGLALPSSGAVTVGGYDLIAQPDKVRETLGVVFQSPAVDKHLSVQENLDLHADLYGLRGQERVQAFEQALDWTDLKERLSDRVDTLSGGLARQVELAKCLLTRPKVLLLDEPTTGLDPNSRRNFLDALNRLHEQWDMTILMTSHIFDEAEDADLVAIMKDGDLLAFDAPQTLRGALSREVVVIQPKNPDALAQTLRQTMSLSPLRYGDELRIDDVHSADSLTMLDDILAAHRDEILSISIKKPSLEDVFIHVTTAGSLTEEQAEDPPPLLETGS